MFNPEKQSSFEKGPERDHLHKKRGRRKKETWKRDLRN